MFYKNPFQLEKVVKLEAGDPSIIGRVDAVRWDEKRKLLYVGDFEFEKAIFKFTEQGRFLKKFGSTGLGPGEYMRLISFDVFPDQSVVLATSPKLIHLNRNGELVKEVILNYLPAKCVVFNQNIYVLKLISGGSPDSYAIYVYSKNLVLTHRFHPFESELNRYAFNTWSSLTVRQGHLFVAERYDLSLTAYGSDHKMKSHYVLPGFSDEASSFWQKKNLTEADRTQIKERTHRFSNILGTTDYLFLFDMNKAHRHFRLWVFQEQEKRFIRFDQLKLFNSFYNQDDFAFFHVPGAYSKGLIATIEDSLTYKKFLERFPQAEPLIWQETDNALICFLKLNLE